MKSILPKISQPLSKLNTPTFHSYETQKNHAKILKSGIPIPDTDLVQCYCKFKSFPDARQVFDETPAWDLVSATSIIGLFTLHGRLKEAVHLFSRMFLLGIEPNQFTFTTLIHACTGLKDHRTGIQLHSCAIKVGLQSDVFVGSAALDHYAKLSSIEEARKVFGDTHEHNVVSYTTLICGYLKNERFEEALLVFRNMPHRNVVSWNAIISGFCQKGHNEEAMNLFVEMCREGVEPNESTFPCVFTAAANIAAMGMGSSIHAYTIKLLANEDMFVVNSLISFYAKCGSMEDGLLAFNTVTDRNVVSWNALICGYAQNGRGKEALEFFEMMKGTGLRPNTVTLLCVLFACNHAGLVDEGYAYFDQARREEPNLLSPEHYACMVDLFSRSGRLQEAKKFLQELSFNPGIGFWKALLGGSLIHSNSELIELAAQRILALDPEDSSSYILLSNVYSAAGNWQDVSMIRKKMKEKGMVRIPGCSWIEIRNKVHSFVTGDRTHVQTNEIYRLLRICFGHLNANTTPKVHLES